MADETEDGAGDTKDETKDEQGDNRALPPGSQPTDIKTTGDRSFELVPNTPIEPTKVDRGL